MDKTVIIPPITPTRLWLVISTLLLAGFFIIGLVLITLLNGGWVNHILTPVGSYLSMFQLIWPEQPLGALEFIATKSFLVFAHNDPRSSLNLWTLEYDAITLLVYLIAALVAGSLIARNISSAKTRKGLLTALTGIAFVVIAFTYMTAIEHCSGATWVGFVSLYGLGFSGFDFYPYYQGVFALAGLGLLVWGFVKQRQAQ